MNLHESFSTVLELAVFLQDDRVKKLFSNNVSRFSELSENTFTKLKRDLLSKVVDAHTYTNKKPFIKKSGSRFYLKNISVVDDDIISDIYTLLADVGEIVERLLLKESIKIERDLTFKIPPQASILSAAYAAFNSRRVDSAIKEIRYYDRELLNSAFTEALRSFSEFIEALITLAEPVDHKGYEKALYALIKRDSHYFASGYPKDILVYDKLNAVSGTVLGFIADKEYASSRAILSRKQYDEFVEAAKKDENSNDFLLFTYEPAQAHS